MALDPSIFARFATAPKSVADYDQEAAQLQGTQQANALNALKIQQGNRADQEAQRLLNERVGVTNALAGLPSGADMPTRINALYGLGTQSAREAADTMNNRWIEQQKTTAQTNEQNAKTSTETYGLQQKKLQAAVTQMAAFASPQDAVTHLNAAVGRGEIPMQQALAIQRSMPQNPADFPLWQLRTIASMMDPEKYVTAAKPNVQVRNTGGTTDVLAIPGLGGPASVVSSVKNTVSPDALQQASTSRQNNSANIAKDYAIAGLGPDGKPADGGGLLDPATIANAAARYNIDGTLPPNLGRGAQGPREIASILKEASNQAAERGDTPEAQRIAQLANKANAQALNKITTQQTMVGAFEKNFTKNADIALELSDKNDRTGIPLVNKWVNAGKRSVAGDPDLAAFDASVKATVNEYAKIVSGGSGGGATAQGEIGKVESLLNAAQTKAQVASVLNLMKRETANRMQSFEDQKNELTGSMSRAKPVSAAPAIPADIAAILKKHQ